MSRMIETSPAAGLAVLRVVLGAIFAVHGYEKVFGGIQSTAGFFGMLGIPLPLVSAWLVGLVELVGGLALIFGVGSRVAAALLVPTMLVAIATVHWTSGFSNVHVVGMDEQGPVYGVPGWEFNLALIGGLVGVLIGGAGSFRARAKLSAESEAPARATPVRHAA